MEAHDDNADKIRESEDSFLKPHVIVRMFELSLGDHIAEFGCGHGHFTIPLAQAVGGDGKVYALDIRKEALEAVRSSARREQLWCVETIWTDLERPQGSTLRDVFIDAVLVANILTQVEKPDVLLAEAFRILHENGRLLVLEWATDKLSFGPNPERQITKARATEIATAAGFKLLKEESVGTHHYLLIFTK